jgi:protein FrlC
MKISTSTSVLYQYNLLDAIKIVKRTGYEGVDLWGGRPHVYRSDYSEKDLRELKEIIDGQGLSISSFMPAFCRYPYSLSNPNPVVINDSIEYMQECITNAAVLGAKVVLVVPDLSLKNHERAVSFSRFVESLESIAQFASKFPKIRLGIEILHTDETDLVNSADDVIKITNQLDFTNIGVVLDTGTLNLSKEPIREIFSKIGGKILNIHINDNLGGDKQENLIPGEGTYNFQDLIRVLKDVGYEGFLTVELSKDYADRAETALRTAAERLNNWLDNPGVGF